ncbi:MAG: protein-L-isoaspartate(D-aspartate) O-methyltransferase [Paludibacter sp.]|nr:protein-L-isoaspartate(D-aspartate) O-methyltransferase [Paludibacter sp.]
MNETDYTRLRQNMVEFQIKARGILAENVLEAFLKVRRHVFIPDKYRHRSYEDNPLPIGFEQTISQPYIVAYMTELLKPDKNLRVLEIGTGSGYQTAILSCLCKEVYSIEMIESLGTRTKITLQEEGFNNIILKTGDGYNGWKEFAPYDIIIVTCAPAKIPPLLLKQLAENGKMIIPAGESHRQKLYLIEKKNGKIQQTETIGVRFVPMIRNTGRNGNVE